MPKLKPGLQRVHVAELHVSSMNDKTRTIADDRREQLLTAMRAAPEHIEARPIIADIDGAIIGGRHRWEAAQVLALEPGRTPWRRRYADDVLPVYVKRFKNDAERLEWLTRDNGDYAGWVPDELAPLLASHRDLDDVDMDLLGFSAAELAGLLELAADPSFAPAPPDDGARLDHRLTRSVTCPHCETVFEISKADTFGGAS